jgi:hypothetical protein
MVYTRVVRMYAPGSRPVKRWFMWKARTALELRATRGSAGQK